MSSTTTSTYGKRDRASINQTRPTENDGDDRPKQARDEQPQAFASHTTAVCVDSVLQPPTWGTTNDNKSPQKEEIRNGEVQREWIVIDDSQSEMVPVDVGTPTEALLENEAEKAELEGENSLSLGSLVALLEGNTPQRCSTTTRRGRKSGLTANAECISDGQEDGEEDNAESSSSSSSSSLEDEEEAEDAHDEEDGEENDDEVSDESEEEEEESESNADIPLHPEPEKAERRFRKSMKPILKTIGNQSYKVSTSGPCVHLSLPGLQVKGVDVPIPLSKTGAATLREHGRPSAFGHGLDTVVDPSIRNSIEFDAANVSFLNPNWNAAIKDVADEACRGLGLSESDTGNIRCSLWKALYYPTGSFFKPHQDTEKEPGMFATLVVCLPSTYSGGELTVTHLKGTKKYTFGSVSMRPYRANYVCFFADVTHEVLPVTSGDRVVLTYNIIWKKSTPKAAPSLNLPPATVAAATTAIEEDFTPAPHAAFFGLEHDYTDISVSSRGASCLKGRDKVVFSLLRQCTQQTGTLFFVGHREKNVMSVPDPSCDIPYCGRRGGCYNGEGASDIDWDDVNSEAPTVSWYSLDGNGSEWSEHLHVSDVMLLPGLEDEWPERWAEHDYDGYMGNEGATRYTEYHSWVLAMVPLHYIKKYITPDNLFSLILESSGSSGNDHTTKFLLHEFDRRVNVAPPNSGRYDDKDSFASCLTRLDVLGLRRVKRAMKTMKRMPYEAVSVLNVVSKKTAAAMAEEFFVAKVPLLPESVHIRAAQEAPHQRFKECIVENALASKESFTSAIKRHQDDLIDLIDDDAHNGKSCDEQVGNRLQRYGTLAKVCFNSRQRFYFVSSLFEKSKNLRTTAMADSIPIIVLQLLNDIVNTRAEERGNPDFDPFAIQKAAAMKTLPQPKLSDTAHMKTILRAVHLVTNSADADVRSISPTTLPMLIDALHVEWERKGKFSKAPRYFSFIEKQTKHWQEAPPSEVPPWLGNNSWEKFFLPLLSKLEAKVRPVAEKGSAAAEELLARVQAVVEVTSSVVATV